MNPINNSLVHTLTAVNADDVIYAVSIHSTSFDVELWAYSGACDLWTRLSKYDLSVMANFRISEYNCQFNSAWNKTENMLDVFLQSNYRRPFLIRFPTRPPHPDHPIEIRKCVDSKIQFDGLIGPQMFWCTDDQNLIIGGALQPDGGHKFHLYRIAFKRAINNRSLKYFTVTPLMVFNLGPPHYSLPLASLTVDQYGRLLAVYSKEIVIIDFRDQQPSEIDLTRLNQSISQTGFHDINILYNICSCDNWIWLFCRKSKSCYRRKLDDGIGNVWELAFLQGKKGEHVINRRSCMASSSQLYWLENVGNDKFTVRSKAVGPPSLQFMCLRKLFQSWPTFKNCRSENQARALGLSPSIWRRFVLGY